TACVVPAAIPSYRSAPMVTFDSDRRALIVYGGQSSVGEALTDIWDVDVVTATWTQRTPCGGDQPPPTPSGQLVYDRPRRRAVMVSGTAGQVWDWDPAAGSWTSRPAPAAGPAPTTAPDSAVYDDARG